jgi:IMP dehydrogenase
VLGLGVPQVTATADARPRATSTKADGPLRPIITDGGMTTGGDVCKAFASGADAGHDRLGVRARRRGAGRGYHWGMATPHANLPRGTRIRVGIAGSLEQILFGPAFTEDGTLNLVGRDPHVHGLGGRADIRSCSRRS